MKEENAEMQARDSLHGLSKEELTATLIDSFKSFDSDGNGTLSREEFKNCLGALRLGNTKMTKRELARIMMAVDDDGSVRTG